MLNVVCPFASKSARTSDVTDGSAIGLPDRISRAWSATLTSNSRVESRLASKPGGEILHRSRRKAAGARGLHRHVAVLFQILGGGRNKDDRIVAHCTAYSIRNAGAPGTNCAGYPVPAVAGLQLRDLGQAGGGEVSRVRRSVYGGEVAEGRAGAAMSRRGLQAQAAHAGAGEALAQ